MKRTNVKEQGITLIALVITIIIMLILAGVTIRTALSDHGTIQEAIGAVNDYKDSLDEENDKLASIRNEIAKNRRKGSNGNNNNNVSTERYNIYKGVNKPLLKQGMTPVKFDKTAGTDLEPVEIVETTEDDINWYDYENQKWANAQTEDGSLWVWIPRFAYKIPSENYQTNTAGEIEIHFLVGTSDNYYDNNNQLQQACRCDDDDRKENDSNYYNTSTKVVVHPAFTDESSINYRNGGWDSELTGIWVAKFEAGFANATESGTEILKNEKGEDVKVKSANNKNTATIKDSKIKYTKTHTDNKYTVWKSYRTYDTNTPIWYPTYQGSTYTLYFISINDAFNICRAMTETESGYENIYNLGSDTDSHLMKNSEWGATVYLSQSKYGYIIDNQSDTEILPNTKNNENFQGITGYNNSSQEWNKGGEGASTTQNIYGIYDMSGGTWEYCSAYIPNGNEGLKNHGESLTYTKVNNIDMLKTQSTKYVTVYPYSDPEDSDKNAAYVANYGENTKIYGDGIRETSNASSGKNSWNSNFSYYFAKDEIFTVRGGYFNNTQTTGLFSFCGASGDEEYLDTFRAVLV